MTFLPILRRELLVAARRTATYRQRVLFAGLAVGTVAIMLLSVRSTALSGPMIFTAIAFGGFILSALEGMRATADSIALERREGTLGLLLLTGLRGRQIVLGKVGAACVQSISTVLAILPAFALPLLLGGVTAGECWRVMLTFITTLFFSLTAGALVSSWATQTLTAFVSTFVLVLALAGIPMALSLHPAMTAPDKFIWLAGPLEMFYRVSDGAFILNPSSFWSASAWSLAMSVIMFVAAGFILERPHARASGSRNHQDDFRRADSAVDYGRRPHRRLPRHDWLANLLDELGLQAVEQSLPRGSLHRVRTRTGKVRLAAVVAVRWLWSVAA